jgi:hypothetical protein
MSATLQREHWNGHPVEHALEGKALAVQWAIVAVFLDRVLRARRSSVALF